MRINDLINELDVSAPAALAQAPTAAPAPTTMQKIGRGVGQAVTLGKSFKAGMQAANQKTSSSNALDTVDQDDLKASLTKIVSGEQLGSNEIAMLKRFVANL